MKFIFISLVVLALIGIISYISLTSQIFQLKDSNQMVEYKLDIKFNDAVIKFNEFAEKYNEMVVKMSDLVQRIEVLEEVLTREKIKNSLSKSKIDKLIMEQDKIEKQYIEKHKDLDKQFKDLIKIQSKKKVHIDNSNIDIVDKDSHDKIIIENYKHNSKNNIKINNNKNDKIELVPILLLTCNRPWYLLLTLKELIKIRKDPIKNPIYVSQDCDDKETTYILENDFKNSIHLLRNPNRTKIEPYLAIARHYKWALTEMFDVKDYKSLIILEDDLKVSPDFINYMETMKPLLDSDPSLFCVSAWNDNAKVYLTMNNNLNFLRTDFFPGLGWMLNVNFWNEIKSNWPENYWDDYLRERRVVQGRQCIMPLVPRVSNIGFIGASDPLVYELFLKDITVVDKVVDYKDYDINQLKELPYRDTMKSIVEKAKTVQRYEIEMFNYKNSTLKILYTTQYDYQGYARIFGLMQDLREEVPRGSYKKIVPIYLNSNLVFLVPKQPIDWNSRLINATTTIQEK
ncbi:hypothetical protein CYY_009436 [Polysphondylium violaceum]|uniref:alpha-1,3-mannosyl-glycoprotein 2-beta-N-acetylglucosaminyltransferase n=1 Tax=Polysphondylium violaceum TaxID=133409 RepID=A0A8J4PN44_9MYCE|nr:hypothetical protein CYY_009436 [Polysphondylium violaceum]